MIFQSLLDLRNIYVPKDTAQVEFCANPIEYSYTWSNIYICKSESMWNPNSSTVESDRPQHGQPAACVIAQQYYSATLSLRFYSCKESFGASFKNVTFFYFKNYMRLELRTLELLSRGLSVYWFYLNAESHRERVRNSLLEEVLRDLEFEVGIGEMATNVMCTCEWASGSLKEGCRYWLIASTGLDRRAFVRLIVVWRINLVIARVVCFHGRYLVWPSSG